MDVPTDRLVRLLAMQAAIAAAAVHLVWALPRFTVSHPAGATADLRPYLFVTSALLLLGAATAVLRGAHSRRLYSLATGVLLAHAVGYAWWHLGDHGGLAPRHQSTDPLAAVGGHLLEDPLAFTAVLVELVGVAAFAALFVFEGRRRRRENCPEPKRDDAAPVER